MREVNLNHTEEGSVGHSNASGINVNWECTNLSSSNWACTFWTEGLNTIEGAKALGLP